MVKLHAFLNDMLLAEPVGVTSGLANEMHVLGVVGFKRNLAHDNGSIAMASRFLPVGLERPTEDVSLGQVD